MAHSGFLKFKDRIMFVFVATCLLTLLSKNLVSSLPVKTSNIPSCETEDNCSLTNAILKTIRKNPSGLNGFNLKFRWQDTGKTFDRKYTKVELGDFNVSGLENLKLVDPPVASSLWLKFLSNSWNTNPVTESDILDKALDLQKAPQEDGGNEDDDVIRVKEVKLLVPSLKFCTETKFGLDKEQFSLHTSIMTTEPYHITLGFIYNRTNQVVTKTINGPKFQEKVKYNVTVIPADHKEQVDIAKDIESFIRQNFPSSISETFLTSFAKFITGLRIGMGVYDN
jgi:hypothetical protein